MKEVLEKINPRKNIVVDGDMLSGKTTNVLFPLLKEAINNDENIIVYDTKSEHLNNFYNELTEKGYQIKIINLRDTKHSEGWNPLELPYHYYKSGMQDKAIELLEGFTNIFNILNKNADPFWANTASEFFIGLCLGLFENGSEDEINLNSINIFTTVGEEKSGPVNTYLQEYFGEKEKTDPAYIYASATLKAPVESRESIIFVMKEAITKLIGNKEINNLLNKSTFAFSNITNQKRAIFVIGKTENQTANLVSSLFFHQIMQYLTDNKPNNRCNIVLDSIDSIYLMNFKNYLELNNFSNLRYLISTNSLESLYNQYGTDMNKVTEIIKISKNNIELESREVTEKFENDFSEIIINKADIKYPEAKTDEIKVFDLKSLVSDYKQQRMENMLDKYIPNHKEIEEKFAKSKKEQNNNQ